MSLLAEQLNTTKGTLTQEWTIWCFRCDRWLQSCGRKTECVREFRKGGWRLLTVAHEKRHYRRWFCPDCAPVSSREGWERDKQLGRLDM